MKNDSIYSKSEFMKAALHSALAACGYFCLAGTMLGQGTQSSPGAIFTATNGVNRNEIVMYQRSANGALLFAGRYPTGGRGEGGINDPLQSENSLILSPDHSYLLAVNAGTSDISVFRVSDYGLLLLSVTPSGGGNPVGLAIHDNLVYVVNFGGGGGYHTQGFRLQPWGGLTPIPKSKQPLSNLDPGASSAAFTPDGSKLIVTERVANKIDVFNVNSDGTLSNPVFNKADGVEPFGVQFTPNGVLLVVETNGGPPNNGSLSSFTVNSDNTLSLVTSKADASGQAACWVASNGINAWVSDTATGNIGSYSIGADGTLTSAGSVAQPAATSIPLDLALSDDNQYLYVFYSNVGKLIGYKVGNNGQLAEINSVSPEKPSVGAEGLAAY